MPVLEAEPQTFPEDLFGESRAAAAGRKWWALHTRPRQEKSLARQLYAGGIPYYLPLVSRRLRVRKRFLTSYVPLFPGYLFLLAEAEERITALSTNRIVRAIAVNEQERLWSDLLQTHRLITTGAPITPEGRLLPGTLVEIRSGPLAGLKGKILQTATGRRFVVEIDFIQKGASVLLDDFTLAPIIP